MPRLIKLRTNDTFIMDEICKGAQTELLRINTVRQFMQVVTTLSDICTNQGKSILKHTLLGD